MFVCVSNNRTDVVDRVLMANAPESNLQKTAMTFGLKLNCAHSSPKERQHKKSFFWAVLGKSVYTSHVCRPGIGISLRQPIVRPPGVKR